jgi:peptidoglycan glycosyltransferase
MSAIGEYEVAASPLQMAMVAAAIQNGGVVMKPYLVERVRTTDLKVTFQAIPAPAGSDPQGQAISAETANSLREMMVAVVQQGTGRRAQVEGLEIGGKTGTAQSDRVRNPYAWFVAFASELNVAVCVFVEDAEIPADEIAGARVAAPVAKAVIEALR